MSFDELKKTLSINNERTIRPGLPYVENSKEGEKNLSFFEFNIVKYGSGRDGTYERFIVATIDMTYYMESSIDKSKINWQVDAVQELLKRMEYLGYASSIIDPGVIDKIFGFTN